MDTACSIGIDQAALHTGICVLSDEGHVLYTDTLEPSCKGPERLAFIYEGVTAVATRFSPKIAVWESYSHGSKNQPFTLGEVGGVVQLAMWKLGIQVEACAPSALKKFLSDNPWASKAEMADAVYTRHQGLMLENDHVTDAYGLAQVGRAILAPALMETRKQREVVSVILGTSKRIPKKRSYRMKTDVL